MSRLSMYVDQTLAIEIMGYSISVCMCVRYIVHTMCLNRGSPQFNSVFSHWIMRLGFPMSLGFVAIRIRSIGTFQI